MLEEYRSHVEERAKEGVPPLPLTPEQTTQLCSFLENPPANESETLVSLITDRVSPGVDPSAEVKAEWLGAVAHGDKTSPLISSEKAIELLGTMMGGYNVPYIVRELEGPNAELAAEKLKHITMVFDNFDVVKKLMEEGNAKAKEVVESWAAGEWFTALPELPESIKGTAWKSEGETNTDDLSPAQHASTRPDIPLHANPSTKAPLQNSRLPVSLENN
jgi:aconitate hydratase 2/2-methylisocitrate dehydratase